MESNDLSNEFVLEVDDSRQMMPQLSKFSPQKEESKGGVGGGGGASSSTAAASMVGGQAVATSLSELLGMLQSEKKQLQPLFCLGGEDSETASEVSVNEALMRGKNTQSWLKDISALGGGFLLAKKEMPHQHPLK